MCVCIVSGCDSQHSILRLAMEASPGGILGKQFYLSRLQSKGIVHVERGKCEIDQIDSLRDCDV